MKPTLAIALSLSLLAGLAPARAARADSQASVRIDIRRSLIVTELSILRRFPLQRTMDQLAAQTGIPGLTGEALFRQWFDVMNPASEAATPGPHCDDQFDAVLGVGLLNSFPFKCRPGSLGGEGLEAILGTNPMAGYSPVTLTNRFDAAPADGSHCGEYRIVYARDSAAADDHNRNLIIFEAAMPNPNPRQGLKGCQQIARFWARLSDEPLTERRAEQLERFYYDGYAELEPVVHISHFGGNPIDAGQLRTNMFMQPRSGFTGGRWSMREFKLRVAPGRFAAIFPVTVKVNPYGPLFQSAGTHPLTREFQDWFLTQVPALAVPDFSFNYVVPDRFNGGQSEGNGPENNYVAHLGGDASPFGQRIQAQLTRIGSPLKPTDIVARAQSLSCAGCHQLNANPAFTDAQRSLGGGLVFPRSLGFTQTSDTVREVVDGEESWAISPVLTELLLPARQQLLVDYLTDRLKLPGNPKAPINGRSHH